MYKKIFLIIAIFISLILISIFFPVKFSVKKNKLFSVKKNNEFIIIENIETSGPEWIIVGNQDGYFDKKREPVILYGNIPECRLSNNVNYAFKNRYILYGEFIGELNHKNYSKNGVIYKVYRVDCWEIIYPIRRYSVIGFFFPKSYFNIYDFKYFDK